MLSQIFSSALHGIEGIPVSVEVDFRAGLPNFIIVGLPDASVREAKERVIAAIRNSNVSFPPQKIIINLAPGHIKKEGPSFDLAIALGILGGAEMISAEEFHHYGVMGELGLNGVVKPVRGILPSVLGLKKKGLKGVLLPRRNAKEAAIVDGIKIFPVDTLQNAIDFFVRPDDRIPFTVDRKAIFKQSKKQSVDFSDIKGQRFAKRALEIAAAGGHNVLLIGPPGSGKTLLARRFPTLLPDLDFHEALETTKIHSVVGHLKESEALRATRPFRSPHHHVSKVAIVGGGTIPRPGEVSLAHRGVLFLDEFPEFGRDVLEALRQPLEDRFVTIVRAAGSVQYPADFLLIGAANPCPCGYAGSFQRHCVCSANAIQKYRSKLSGPLLDRVDLHVDVPALKIDEITEEQSKSDSSEMIRQRVVQAREIQKARLHQTGCFENAQMSVRHIKKFCSLDGSSKAIIRSAIKRLGLSARAYDRILKVARTIADLEGSTEIESLHISEAIGYRILDRTPESSENSSLSASLK